MSNIEAILKTAAQFPANYMFIWNFQGDLKNVELLTSLVAIFYII